MGRADDQRHAFIVSVWLEETAEEAGRATWRGEITHVPSGERRSFQRLDEIARFIAPYIAELGVAPRRRRWWR